MIAYQQPLPSNRKKSGCVSHHWLDQSPVLYTSGDWRFL